MRDYAELIKAWRYCAESKTCDGCPMQKNCPDINHQIVAADAIEEQSKRADELGEELTSAMELVHKRNEKIEKLQSELVTTRNQLPHWISVRDVSDEEICAAKMVLSVIENLDKPMLMYDIEKSAVKKALILMMRICEAEPPKEVQDG